MQNSKSKFVDIPKDISVILSEDGEFNDDDARLLSPWARKNEIELGLNDGDCLIVDRNGYRNDGKFLWDAHKREVISFAFDLDDYGCIPPEFNIRRFPPHYFSDILDHNSFVRLDKDLVDEIIQHAVYEDCPVTVKLLKDQKVVWSYFMLKKEKYYVIGIPVDVDFADTAYVPPAGRTAVVLENELRAANFMRIFIDRVKEYQIKFRNDETGEEDAENILFVSC